MKSMAGFGGGVASLSMAGSGDGIYQALETLLGTLNGISPIPTPANFYNVPQIIHNTHPSFNVFAIVGSGNYSESLSGTGVAGGRGAAYLTSKTFLYNTSSSNILSTGKDIVDMSGGAASGISGASVIDGKKWMAMAQFDGSNFDGILLWIFTGDSVTGAEIITSNGRPVTKARDIFYPVGVGNNDYHHIYPIALTAGGGTVYSNFISGRTGWNFSIGSSADSATGFRSTGNFSQDDGAWGFRIATSNYNGFVDGNSPGPSQFQTGSNAPGFGMGNYDSSDGNNYTYWNGTDNGNANNLGFVFTGDA